MAVPEGREVMPYGIILLLGNTNTALPEKPCPYCWYYNVCSATVPIVFVHLNTGESTGNTAAVVPGVFNVATKSSTHSLYV